MCRVAAHLGDVHHVGHEGEALQFELGDVGLQQDVDLGTPHNGELLITDTLSQLYKPL